MLPTNFWASLWFMPKPSVDMLMTLITAVIRLTACDVYSTTYSTNHQSQSSLTPRRKSYVF